MKGLIFTFTLQQLSDVALSRDVRQGDDGVSEHHRSWGLVCSVSLHVI